MGTIFKIDMKIMDDDFRLTNNYPQKDRLLGIIIPPEYSYSELKQQILQNQKITELVKLLQKMDILVSENTSICEYPESIENIDMLTQTEVNLLNWIVEKSKDKR